MGIKTTDSKAKFELDRILVKYHTLSIEEIIEMTAHMHHLATKLHLFAKAAPAPTTDKDTTNN